MSFEKYTQFYEGKEDGVTLRSHGKAVEFKFNVEPENDKRYRLFTVGETEQFYMWKNEPDSPQLYRMITDALDTKHAIRDRYCLDLSCKQSEDYIKRVYKKISWPPLLSYLKMTPVPEEWRFGITVSARDLCVCDGGYLRMRLDIRKKKEGVDPRSVSGEPDERVIIDFPDGTYTAKKLSLPVNIPSDTAHVGVFIEGKGYFGECYVEAPQLSAIGQNLLPSFSESTPGRPQFEWVGQYLSRKEWPEFRISLNGKEIFAGEVFERCHRHSEWEIDLPVDYLKKENTVIYELISSYHDPLPYTVYEAGIIEQSAGDFSIIAVSECAPEGGKARVLIRTERENMRVKLDTLNPAISAEGEYFFSEKGLHGILINCNSTCFNAGFCLSADGHTVFGSIGRIVKKGYDGVVTGSGDMVYVHQDIDSIEEYLSWFLSNHIGDLITVRPVYRWSGTRALDADVWRRFCRLMKELDLKYVLMRDGREVEGLCTQPDAAMLAGDGFYGIQMHEVDNTYYYGGLFRTITSHYDEMVEDLISFAFSEDPEHASSRWNVTDKEKFVDGVMCSGHYRSADWSFSELRERSVSAMKALRRESDTRHTGPSAMFKYMADAGFSQLGAETMYNTMEPLMGFLRGVARDRNMLTYGVHHAVQWSTTPHNTPARYRRYRLALYASYLLGATDINTEEGLWHMEEYYEHHHRFGDACIGHLNQQRDFYRYVSSHTRSGSLYSPLALIHGRDDGVTFFGKNRTWGRRNLPQTPADDSWDLLKVIYPASNPVERMYIHNCPDDVQQGYHSGTPYGNVDAVPMEGELSTLEHHRSLVFIGYNRYVPEDAKKLDQYVINGGRILLTRAHLTTSDDVDSLFSGNLAFSNGPISFCDGEQSFRSVTYNGEELSVCVNCERPDDILEYTDSGEPLVCVYRRGMGSVILFNTKEYPSHKSIKAVYARMIEYLIRDETEKENVWAEGSDNVEFAVYKQNDGKAHVYFLATDWYKDPVPLRFATLRIGRDKYRVSMPFGALIKVVSDGARAAWPECEDGEVISVDSDKIYVQGVGKINFCIAYGGHTKRLYVDFSDGSPKIIDLNLHF